MSSTHVVQQRASLWHLEPVAGMMSRVRWNTGAKTWKINEDQRYVKKSSLYEIRLSVEKEPESKSVTTVQCEQIKVVTEELCCKYLSGAQPRLQLSALSL